MTLKAAIGVMSCAKYGDRQERCRRTWFSELAAAKGINLFFVIGDMSRSVPVLVKDTLFVPCGDSYTDLRAKVHAFFKWTTKNMESQYIVKCDDDTYVHPNRFLTCLSQGHQYTGKGMRGNDYAGGGGGYILSAEAARIVAEQPEPAPGSEDVWVGRCFAATGFGFERTPASNPA